MLSPLERCELMFYRGERLQGKTRSEARAELAAADFPVAHQDLIHTPYDHLEFGEALAAVEAEILSSRYYDAVDDRLLVPQRPRTYF